jgi:deoxyribonuclease V
MGPFPPPDPIGRDGSFLCPFSPIPVSLGDVAWGGGYPEVMKIRELHDLDLSPSEASRLQKELAPQVSSGPALDLSGVDYVAGADVSTQGDWGYATVVVLDFPGLSPVEVQGFETELSFPYVPGLLAFREIPAVAGALAKVQTPVDAAVFDAQGLAHPRRMGLASHLGLFLDVPSVGCAKTRLVGTHEEPGNEKGGTADLVHKGEVIGKVLRTRKGVSPVYVSVGNGVDLDSAVELVLACSPKYRLPETTRQAHNAANRLRRGEPVEGTLF